MKYQTMNDPVIDEIRRVRNLISAEIGSGDDGMVEYYGRYQSAFVRPAITPESRHSAMLAPLVTGKAETTDMRTEAAVSAGI